MTNILALSGRKGSGKNTSFNFLLGIELLRLYVVRNKIEIHPNGKLFISDIFGDTDYCGIFDIDRNNARMERFRNENIYPFIRNYSFADILKKDICIDLLGLGWEQCYGTDEEKNTETDLLWEDMPGVLTKKDAYEEIYSECDFDFLNYYPTYHEPGPMTAREVMQFVGTEIFRKMYHPVWAEGTIRRIQQDGSQLAVITDCRFPNEVEAVQKAGGRVIRFTRSPYEDNHESETALDDFDNFDHVIDNSQMTISEQNEAVYTKLNEWDWFEGIEIPNAIEIK